MRKALRLVAILAAFGLIVWIGVVALAQGSSTPTPSTSTTRSPATGGEDVKGNCDEAEHANDPECVGVNLVPEDDHENDDQGENEDNDDQGDNEDDQGDNSGPGSENSGSGSENSGPGSEDSGSGSGS